jgi:hypothetical protein
MRLIDLTIEETKNFFKLDSEGKPEIITTGTCEFQGESGNMCFALTGADIQTVEQVLTYRCKQLAQEA